MRNGTWLVVMAVLWGVLITGIVTGEMQFVAAALGGFGVVVVERLETRRRERA